MEALVGMSAQPTSLLLSSCPDLQILHVPLDPKSTVLLLDYGVTSNTGLHNSAVFILMHNQGTAF